MKNPTHTHLFFSLLFFLFQSFFFTEMVIMAQNTTVPVNVNVGVVLDFDTSVGEIGLSCISMALSDFYASHGHYKTRLKLHTRNSKRDIVGAAAAALDLIKNVEVQAIIGPQSSMQANFIINLGVKAHVPIISFSATSPSLSSLRSPYFFRATQNDSSQVKAISAIVKAFGWREAVPIYVDNEYGEGILPCLTDALQEIDTRVPYRSVIPPSATDDQIGQELYKLMTMQTRVFIVHMLPILGSRFFSKAKEVGMMSEGYVWIVTNGIGNHLSSMNLSVIDSMQGVLVVENYVPQTKELEDFSIRWKKKFYQANRIINLNAKANIYGLWAHDAALALAMAIEKVGATNFGFQKTNISGNSTDLSTLGVSQIGLKISQALSNTVFQGLGGDFHLVDGQLPSSAFQIVNVIGQGREIGFWTPQDGIIRKLKTTNTGIYSTSKANLGTIIWPSETISVPKGWAIPTNGKKLKIGVPKKNGFFEFVNVTQDLSTNTTSVTGYCIDVFNAVMKVLPYHVPYEFMPFEKKPGGESAGSYDDLIYQVYLQKYDAVVGDTTIVANRSSFVDFTLPYTDSGVSMIVPIKESKRKNAWVFLKPLTWDLWVTSGCFFIFIGFVIWVLEHRINEDFRGPPSHQVGTMFWFSFSTMVFAHREKVVSNLARFVVIIWVFVVLILTQSYTASLTSMLTVQNLQPAFTDVNELIKSGEYVGYLEGSFVFELLKQMKFDESKLKRYNSSEEYDEALSKGSANGGIAAVFDEIPYIRLFLAKYCSKYTMVGPTYKTGGFGFVFPIGSPLVPDVSRAILNVTEGEEMVKIEKTWFGQQTSCRNSSTTSVSSNSLGLDSFWGLFLIAGIASSLALVIFTAMFLYEHRQVLMHFDPKASLRRKVAVMVKHFDEKDLSCHTFRKSSDQLSDRSEIINGMDVVEASPTTTTSPSSISNHTDRSFGFYGEQGTPSVENGSPSPNRQTS